MLKIYNYPDDNIEKVLNQSKLEFSDIKKTVDDILRDIKKRGNDALFELTRKFDKLNIDKQTVKVTKEEIDLAYEKITSSQLEAIRNALKNVYDFHIKHSNKSVFGEENGKQTGVLVRP
ncbi:MAG: histidinol dehydrogenase, partial [Bacillota bacterium]